MIEGKQNISNITKILEKSFDSGILIPTKMRFCNECNDIKMCDRCNNQINENKEFEAKLNLLKRNAPNEFGYMLLIIKYNFQLFVLNHLLYTCFRLFILYTLANFSNFSKVYVFNLRSINPQQDEHLTFLLSNVLKSF